MCTRLRSTMCGSAYKTWAFMRKKASRPERRKTTWAFMLLGMIYDVSLQADPRFAFLPAHDSEARFPILGVFLASA